VRKDWENGRLGEEENRKRENRRLGAEEHNEDRSQPPSPPKVRQAFPAK
jgi:hypothetical protein